MPLTDTRSAVSAPLVAMLFSVFIAKTLFNFSYC
jgi:hypothetical protein